jgi:6-phosphogluconolactonase
MSTAMRTQRSVILVLLAILLPVGVCLHAQAPVSLGTKSPSTGHGLGPERVALYAGVGAELTHYEVDVEEARLIKRASITLPGNVQYAWPHPSRRYFYVAWSTGGPPTVGVRSPSGRHGVSAFHIDPVSGVLHLQGPSAALSSRPIHLSTDISGTHLLVAYNDPSGVTVHRIEPDGTIGSQIEQADQLDVGIYAHQVRVDPSNKMAILVTRGNGPSGNKPEDPGALKIFGYADGLLINRASIAPGGGYNFQPRHLDFHPSRPWVFVSLERQNKLEVYERTTDRTLGSEPLFIKDTLADPGHVRLGQEAGTLHMHPSGKVIYIANRASGTADAQGLPVFVGGENSIAVFAINQVTGEPTLIQSVDTRGMTPRTFTLDPRGRILVVGNQLPLVTGASGISAPPNLAIFRIRADGKLDFIRSYDVPATGGRSLFWVGLVALS